MSDAKKWVEDEIKKRMKRKQDRKVNAAENLILAFMDDIEDVSSMASDQESWGQLVYQAINALEQQFDILDPGCRVCISWALDETEVKLPQVNGVMIKWSEAYQKANCCEPELFIDVTILLLA